MRLDSDFEVSYIIFHETFGSQTQRETPPVRPLRRRGERRCGFSSYVGRGVFAAWTEPGLFDQVRLAEGGHPEWPGGIDLCPDSLYMRLTGKRPEEVFPILKRLSTHA